MYKYGLPRFVANCMCTSLRLCRPFGTDVSWSASSLAQSRLHRLVPRPAALNYFCPFCLRRPARPYDGSAQSLQESVKAKKQKRAGEAAMVTSPLLEFEYD